MTDTSTRFIKVFELFGPENLGSRFGVLYLTKLDELLVRGHSPVALLLAHPEAVIQRKRPPLSSPGRLKPAVRGT